MLESVRRSIGLRVARFRFRKSPDKVISFTQSVSSARHALLIMPLEQAAKFPTAPIVQMMKQKFGDDNITVVAPGDHPDIARLLPRSTLVKFVVGDLTFFFLPHKEFINRVSGRTYDLAVDLNLDLVLPSAYICKESNARVRVGFVGRHADVFYNFQVQQNPALNRQLIYDRLARCLEMF